MSDLKITHPIIPIRCKSLPLHLHSYFIQMYKQIYEQIKLILVSPSKFWKQLAEDNNKKEVDVASHFVYPLLGIVALSAFFGIWWNNDSFNLAKALQIICVDFVAGFAGFFIAAFLIDELSFSVLKIEKRISRSRQFAGFSSVVIYLSTIILNILPSLFFIYLLLFYIVYIVWEGSDIFMNVAENDKQKFTIGASAILILSPLMVQKLLYMLLPGI